MNDRLIWVDLETTGLDPATDLILEVAVVITDGDLNELTDPFVRIVRPSFKAITGLDDYVREMHTASGLLDDLDMGQLPDEVEGDLTLYLSQHVGAIVPLAGSTVSFDRSFLAAHMRTVLGYASHRNVDVSSIKELALRWRPDVVESLPAKLGNHRALPDIRDSIAELRHYRNSGFIGGAHAARMAMPEMVTRLVPDALVSQATTGHLLLSQPAKTYDDPAAASDETNPQPAAETGGATSRKHRNGCKICTVLSELSDPEKAVVTAAFEDDDLSAMQIAHEFYKRGARVSKDSVLRHRKALREGVR